MTADSKTYLPDTQRLRAAGPMDRRDAIRLLSALGGAAFGTLVLPTNWDAPRLEFGILPAHAYCSATNPSCANDSSCPAQTCSQGAVSIAFDAGSPAKASFLTTRATLEAGNQFRVQLDRATKAVTIEAIDATQSTVASAVLGTVTNGVLTYTWAPDDAPNTVNVIANDASNCTGLSNHNTFDVSITFDGSNYTLNLSGLSTALCSYT